MNPLLLMSVVDMLYLPEGLFCWFFNLSYLYIVPISISVNSGIVVPNFEHCQFIFIERLRIDICLFLSLKKVIANCFYNLFITYSDHIQFSNRVHRIRALPLHIFIKIIFIQPITFFKCYENPSVQHISLQSTFWDTALIIATSFQPTMVFKTFVKFRNRVLIRGLFALLFIYWWSVIRLYFFPVRGESPKLIIRNYLCYEHF